MKHIIFFPYHPDIYTIIKELRTSQTFCVDGLISFNEDRIITNQINLKLRSKLIPDEDLIKSCDTIVLLDNYRDYRLDKYYSIITQANEYNKEIVVSPSIAKKLNIRKICGQYRIMNLQPQTVIDKLKDNKLYHTNIPIIVVLGQGEFCGKFETELLLKHVFINNKYKTALISSNALGAILGDYTLPDFLFDDNISFVDKVFLFNHFIFNLSVAENPDVIIIGIPEGIAPFNAGYHNHFGLYASVIGNALYIDAGVMCVYFTPDLNENALQNINNICINKFNAPINAISISKIMNEQLEPQDNSYVFNFLDDNYLTQYYPNTNNYDYPVIDLFNTNNAKDQLNIFLNLLSGNLNSI